jgi:hypothetical protein
MMTMLAAYVKIKSMTSKLVEIRSDVGRRVVVAQARVELIFFRSSSCLYIREYVRLSHAWSWFRARAHSLAKSDWAT